MSILWTKKVERLCCFFEFLILLLLRCHITNCTMDSFAVIPALYIFKDCPAGLFGILISMKIDFFLFQYRMERFDTGIVIWISLSAKGMPYLPAVQELLKWLACILASQVAVENDPSGLPDVQTGVLNSFCRQFRCHGCSIRISDDLTAAQVHYWSQTGPALFSVRKFIVFAACFRLWIFAHCS